jgi:hypothetical protein
MLAYIAGFLFLTILLLFTLFLLCVLLGFIKLDEHVSINISLKKKIERPESKRIYAFETTLIGLPTALETRRENPKLAVIEEFLERADYFVATLGLAVITYGNNQILLCRLTKGEWKGKWQFPGGYVHPVKEREWIKDPKKKADFEIRNYLGLDPGDLDYKGNLTEDKPFLYDYSNPGHVQAMIYIYSLRNPNLSSSSVEYRLFDLAEIQKQKSDEVIPLEDRIPVYVYDILEQYIMGPLRNLANSIEETKVNTREILAEVRELRKIVIEEKQGAMAGK